jgi:hypothetical protein
MERRTARKKTEKGASPLDRVWAWLGWFRVEVDKKDGPRKGKLHSLSHSKHFSNLNLGCEKTKVWTRFCKHFLNLTLLENNL